MQYIKYYQYVLVFINQLFILLIYIYFLNQYVSILTKCFGGCTFVSCRPIYRPDSNGGEESPDNAGQHTT